MASTDAVTGTSDYAISSSEPFNRVRIQIMSDLHLEFGRSYESFSFKPTAPYLALLGDIGRTIDEPYFAFLGMLLTNYDKVFLVMGNHEGYGSSYVLFFVAHQGTPSRC